MKNIMLFVYILLIACVGVQAETEKNKVTIGPKVFVGASVIAGFNTPMVSYGFGGRLHYRASEEINSGLFAELDWNRRGGIKRGVTTALDYIDIGFGPYYSRTHFYFSAGASLGVLVLASEDAEELADNPFNRVDLGGIVSIGGFFSETEPRSLLVFEHKTSGLNAFPPEWPRTVAANITWGVSYYIYF